MINEIPTPERQIEEDPWNKQLRLIAEMNDLVASGSSAEEIAPKADEVNRHVADLVEQKLVDDEAAWALSVGINPYLEDPYQHGDF